MNENMTVLWIGVLSGFIAAAMFSILIRMLPAKWVRYQISFGELYKESGIGLYQWLLTVRLNPPRWKRILMDPLRESLLVQVRQGKGAWVQSKWVEGDVNTFRLIADAAMSVPALIFVEQNGAIYIADSYPERSIIQDGSYDTWVRIIRDIDDTIAGEIGIAVTKLNQTVTATITKK